MVTLTDEQKELVNNLAKSALAMDKEMKRLRDIEGEEGPTILAMLDALNSVEGMSTAGFDH